MVKVCRKCQTLNIITFEYCPKCGSKLISITQETFIKLCHVTDKKEIRKILDSESN